MEEGSEDSHWWTALVSRLTNFEAHDWFVGKAQCYQAATATTVLCNKQPPQTQWHIAVHINHHTHAHRSVGQLEQLYSYITHSSGTRAFFPHSNGSSTEEMQSHITKGMGTRKGESPLWIPLHSITKLAFGLYTPPFVQLLMNIPYIVGCIIVPRLVSQTTLQRIWLWREEGD